MDCCSIFTQKNPQLVNLIWNICICVFGVVLCLFSDEGGDLKVSSLWPIHDINIYMDLDFLSNISAPWLHSSMEALFWHFVTDSVSLCERHQLVFPENICSKLKTFPVFLSSVCHGVTLTCCNPNCLPSARHTNWKKTSALCVISCFHSYSL